MSNSRHEAIQKLSTRGRAGNYQPAAPELITEIFGEKVFKKIDLNLIET